MPDDSVLPSRTPPEHVNRTTRRGADQYVLACNARRDASDIMFAQIEYLEQRNRRARADVKWKLEHASKRTSRWVHSVLTIATYVLVGMAGLTGWMLSPSSRSFRIGLVEGNYHYMPPTMIWSKPHFLTSDMTQHEIDSLIAHAAMHMGENVK
ncbi:MAG: hypothetical protein V4550_08985 [Gemmatimonadota bacterium]